MKKSIILSLVSVCFAIPAYSAENIELDDVVVTAARMPQPRESVIADVTVIDREEIERAGQTTFAELLQTQPGIEISNNGGAGKLSTLFLRGTNSNQVVVLVDGMRVGSATAGLTALENLPLNLINKIEILRGPASSLYGQDAVGGVIQIFTKKGAGAPKFYANLGYGSYNTTKAGSGFYGRVNDTSFAFNLSASRTDGFSALNSNAANINDNDGYKNLGFSANVSQKLNDYHELGVQLFNSSGKTQFDSNFDNFSSYSKLQQRSLALNAKNKWTSFWQSSLRVGIGQDKSKSYASSPINPTRFDTEQTQINWQNDFYLPLGTLTLMYDRLEEEVSSTTAFSKNNRVDNGYVASYLANIDKHSVHLSLREDRNSQFGNTTTGGIGYGFKLNDDWRVKASYGTAFKAPTFNDTYYPFEDFGAFGTYQGNPNLRPEKSRNRELSLSYETSESRLSATIFHNKVRDLILGTQGLFNDTATNLGSVTIKGLTLAASQNFDNFDVVASADIQSAKDDNTGDLLPRRARRHAALSLNYTLDNWHFGSEFAASSARYNDAANQFKLAGYGLVNFLADYKFSRDWRIEARLNNALNKDYTLSTSASTFGPSDPAYNTSGSNLFVNIRYEPQ